MRTYYCNQINESKIDKEIQVCGWVNKIRDHGGVIFIDLRDIKGLVQIVVNPDNTSLFNLEESLRSEYIISVTGKPRLSHSGSENMKIASEEIIGPIINIFKTNNIESAISFSNIGKYGLSFSIYTTDNKTAETFIKNIDASLCHVNLPTPYRDVALPFSGWKQSGKGIPESGRFSRDAFTKTKVVYTDEI